MTYVVDTNIVLYSLVNDRFGIFFEENFLTEGNTLIISVVTEGELKSLAKQRKWGERRIRNLNWTLEKYIIYPVKVESLVNNYAIIDAYSQSKLVNNPLPKGITARNMGKNDLWIAATAYTINAKLVTTDKDFDHLDGTFLGIDCINVQDFIQ